MGDDQGSPPLARRLPGATRAAPGEAERPVLPEALLQRMQAVVSAAHAQAAEEQRLAGEEEAGSDPAARPAETGSPSPSPLPQRKRAASNGRKPPGTALPNPSPPRWSNPDDEANADDDTSPLPHLTASGAIAVPDTENRDRHAAKRERAAHPRSRAHRPNDRRHRPAVLVATALVLVAGGSLAVALSARGAKPTSAPRAPALAVAWVANEVSRTATVACDPAMCRMLEASGVEKLLVLGPPTADPRRSQLIIATAAVREEFGASLASAYAPSVIAGFGSGSARIDIRVVAPNGPAAYQAALNTDVQNRKRAGAELLGSPRVAASAPARRQMLAGQVDSQLLLAITGLASYSPVDVVAFGDSAPGASAGIPLRSAELAETGGAAAMRNWLAFLHVQKGQFAPALVKTIRLSGHPVLLIEFAAPTPLGLFAS